MCALCGVLLSDHWAEADGGRRGRTFRVGLVNRVLAHYGLRLDDWAGRVYVLRDRKGRSVVVDNLGVLWTEAATARRQAARPARPGARRTPLADVAGRTPVALLTGFLGSGKTTLLSRLLAHPGDGRDGRDRQRARRGRGRPPPAAPRRRAHGRAQERLRLLHAARRPRRRAARPARQADARGGAAVPARRGRDDGPGRPGADPLHAPLGAGRQEPLRARARDRDGRRAARPARPRVAEAGGRGRPARRHEGRSRRPERPSSGGSRR